MMILILLCFIWTAGTVAAQPLSNDLTGEIGIHDPVLIKDGNTYHAFGTHDVHLVSTDRKDWKKAAKVFPAGSFPGWVKAAVPGNTGDLWAPDIHFRDGKFHYYYAVSSWASTTSAIGYATNKTLDAASPEYAWVDHGPVVQSIQGQDNAARNNTNAIDPNVFVDSSGNPWLNWGSFCCAPLDGVRLIPLDRQTGKSLAEPPKPVDIASIGEGSFIMQRGQYFYLFVSIGICCAGVNSTYRIVMGRSRALAGPYLDKSGKDMNRGGFSEFLAGDERYPGLGHNGLFFEKDTSFVVFHAYDRQRNGGSVLFIKPFFFDKEGWPTLEPSKAVSLREERVREISQSSGHRRFDFLGRRATNKRGIAMKTVWP